MVIKKPKVVIIGAGMAGLTAANKLYTCAASKDLIELCVVEGGSRIGGRINTSEFGGDRIEMGATWIHGIGGSPIHRIAQETNSLQSEHPWECMDGFLENPTTIAEGGFKLKAALVDSISAFFNKLMDFAQGKLRAEGESSQEQEFCRIASEVSGKDGEIKQLSVGSFLRRGLEAFWESVKDHDELKGYGNWSKKLVEEAIFAMHENIQRTYTSAGDLFTLDYNAESEYQMFPGEEITIAKGYMSVIESLAFVLPPGLVLLGRQVTRIEWKQDAYKLAELENGHADRPVRIHFSDGAIISADHVIVTVSLGVLKVAIQEKSGMFSPPLPSFKIGAISRLGYGVVNKLFLQLSSNHSQINDKLMKFPLLQMLFHRQDSELKQEKIPWWMRRTNSICPIYQNSNVLLSWFAGEEALELEKLGDEEIVNGVSTTISSLLHDWKNCRPQESCNGSMKSVEISNERDLKIRKVLKSKWGSDPLFLGSYSYVAVGSSGDDLDIMAEPLPMISNSCPLLQILFAGEATHRTHYSTTHGAYFSGLREANRILQHYQYL